MKFGPEEDIILRMRSICNWHRRTRVNDTSRVDIKAITDSKAKIIPREHLIALSKTALECDSRANLTTYVVKTGTSANPFSSNFVYDDTVIERIEYSTADLLKTVCVLQEMLDNMEDMSHAIGKQQI